MKIAVPTEGEEVFQHFGNTKLFTVFEIEGDRIIKKSMLAAREDGHEALAALLDSNKIDTLICGGIGGGAKNTLRILGIEIMPGVTGKIKEVIVRYLSGERIGDPNFVCNHNHEGIHFQKDGKPHVCKCF